MAEVYHNPEISIEEISTPNTKFDKTCLKYESHHKSCFSMDSLVLTAKGNKKLRNVKIGDEVLSWDFSSYSLRPSKVIGVSIKADVLVCDMQTSSDEIVTAVPERKFYSIIDSNFLSVKNILESSYPKIAVLSDVTEFHEDNVNLHQTKIVKFNNPRKINVMHIELEKFNNYFINGILVGTKQ